MSMDSIIQFFSDDKGLFAAISAVVAIVGALLGIIYKVRQGREKQKDAKAELAMSIPIVTQPPPWSEAGQVSFQLMNSHGLKAVMTKMLLVILEHRPSEKLKMVQAAAPIPQLTYKVKLKPDQKEYDVRQKIFGEPPAPRSYEKGEVESIIIELTSTEPQWYEFQLIVEWYNVDKPDEIRAIKSQALTIEFTPEVETLINR